MLNKKDILVVLSLVLTFTINSVFAYGCAICADGRRYDCCVSSNWGGVLFPWPRWLPHADPPCSRYDMDLTCDRSNWVRGLHGMSLRQICPNPIFQNDACYPDTMDTIPLRIKTVEQ